MVSVEKVIEMSADKSSREPAEEIGGNASVFKLLGEPPDVQAELFRLIHQIPPGKVTTYRALAEALGDLSATRWVAHVLLHHPHESNPIRCGRSTARSSSAGSFKLSRSLCPCHRVVRSDGSLGQYAGGSPAEKRALLAAEGIRVAGDEVDLGDYFFEGFQSSSPLRTLHEIQKQVAAAAQIQPLVPFPQRIAGIDLAYLDDAHAVATFTLSDLAARKLVASIQVCAEVRFPYISGFLAFRELGLMLSVLQKAESQGFSADLILVDGSGILHPRGAGVATHLGMVADRPTVGVTKKCLCGQLRDDPTGCGRRWLVVHEDRVAGLAIPRARSSKKRIFLSPGHGTDLNTCREVAEKLIGDHPLPEPIYWADRFSRQAVRAKRLSNGA